MPVCALASHSRSLCPGFGCFALATGNPSLINWHAKTPWWIADFLPNIEAEVGMLLICIGMVPIYWPARQ